MFTHEPVTFTVNTEVAGVVGRVITAVLTDPEVLKKWERLSWLREVNHKIETSTYWSDGSWRWVNKKVKKGKRWVTLKDRWVREKVKTA